MNKIPTAQNLPPKTSLSAAKRLLIARGVVAKHAPFFGSLLFNHEMVNASDRIPTMAIDGKCIYYHEDYVRGLEVEELHFELCHEVSHVFLGHLWRFKGRHHKIANKAADLVIDEMLVDSLRPEIFKLPKWCKLDRDLVKKGGYTMEGVYNLLLQDAKFFSLATGGKPLKGRPADDVIQAPLAEQEALEARVKSLTSQASLMQDQHGVGDISKSLERVIREILHPRLPWRVLLRRYMNQLVVNRESRSWARMGRRSFAMGVPVPSHPPTERIRPVAVGVDCSGSITDEILATFQPEVRSVIEDCQPPRTDILYFDSVVCKHDVVMAGEPIVLKNYGGGGTNFSPVIAAANTLEEPPEVLIMLTDLICWDYGPAPDFPVLWVVYGRDPEQHISVPFGEVIFMEEFSTITH